VDIAALLSSLPDWPVLAVIALSLLSALAPYMLAIWLGRVFESRAVYIWGALAAVLLSLVMSFAFQLALELQPELMMDVLDTLYGQVPG